MHVYGTLLCMPCFFLYSNYFTDIFCLVTEKVYESETASSEEEPIKASTNIENKDSIKKESIQPPKKKPVNKSTQSSLTSFFKRV